MKDRQRSEKMKVQKGKSKKRRIHRKRKSILESPLGDPATHFSKSKGKDKIRTYEGSK